LRFRAGRKVTAFGRNTQLRGEGSLIVEWDLGLRGLALLLGISLGFGLAAQLLMWRVTTHWFWLIAGVVYFASGLLISEVWFGWATEEDLQPNIDGLSFDEAVFISLVPGLLTMLVAWIVARRTRAKPPHAPAR
jgi:hypothetical protein